jgi:hypothetical protein
LTVEAGRQIVIDLPNLLFDDVVVIDQPFGRGSDGRASAQPAAEPLRAGS